MVRKRAFTLIELLVVITIIGILMALLMPGLSAMREQGRRAQCSNNLKQIALAFQSHISANGFYPTGGWGYGWAGDPDRGFGVRQPGGWIYNILPFMDNVAIHDMGKGRTIADKMTIFCDRAQVPIPIFNCPTRRRPMTYTFNARSAASPAINFNAPGRAARSDYAANGGSIITASGWIYVSGGANWSDFGPPVSAISATSPSETDDTLANRSSNMERRIYTTSVISGYSLMGSGPTGIMFSLSQITPAHVRDGASNTYMVAEKHLNPDRRTTGDDWGDSLSMYCGEFREITRYTREPPMLDTNSATGIYYYNTTSLADLTVGFGSSHASGFNVAFCDGSVRLINYAINIKIHRALSTRDGADRVDYLNQTVNNNDPDKDGLERPVKPDDIP